MESLSGPLTPRQYPGYGADAWLRRLTALNSCNALVNAASADGRSAQLPPDARKQRQQCYPGRRLGKRDAGKGRYSEPFPHQAHQSRQILNVEFDVGHCVLRGEGRLQQSLAQ